MTFNEFVNTVLEPWQVMALRDALRKGRKVHLYGKQGTGKTLLFNALFNVGYEGVTESALYDPFYLPSRIDGSYALPRNPRNVVLLEMYGAKAKIPYIKDIHKPFPEQEVINWVLGEEDDEEEIPF